MISGSRGKGDFGIMRRAISEEPKARENEKARPEGNSAERSLAFVFLARELTPREFAGVFSLGSFPAPVFVSPRLSAALREYFRDKAASPRCENMGFYSFSFLEKLQGSTLNRAAIVFDSLNMDTLLRLSGMLAAGGSLLALASGTGDRYEGFLKEKAASYGFRVITRDTESAAELTEAGEFIKEFFCRAAGNEPRKTVFTGAGSCSGWNDCELSPEQQDFYFRVTADYCFRPSFRIFLTGPRGSGKTLTVRRILAKLTEEPGKEVSSGRAPQCPQKCAQKRPGILFGASGVLNKNYDPDKLVLVTRENMRKLRDQVSFLMIEEALMLPVAMLREALELYPRVLMVSTGDGYEGSGQGFRNIVIKDLHADVFEFTKRYRYCYDRLSDFLKEALFLPDFIARSSIADPENGSGSGNNSRRVKKAVLYRKLDAAGAHREKQGRLMYACCHFAALLDVPETLWEVSEIIHRNHYETSPQDLARWLRDPEARVLLLYEDGGDDSNDDGEWKNERENGKDEGDDETGLCSILVFREEGGLTGDLAAAVFNGERQPPGNLLPQTLMAHAGIAGAGLLRYLRAERIITRPELRRRKYGSRLLHYLKEQRAVFCPDTIDFIGAAFAFKPDTYAFWKANGFLLVHAGITKDAASGMASAICLWGCHRYSRISAGIMAEKFRRNLPLREIRYPLPAWWHAAAVAPETFFSSGEISSSDAADYIFMRCRGDYSDEDRAILRRLFIPEQHSSSQDLSAAFRKFQEMFPEELGDLMTPELERALNFVPDMTAVESCARKSHSISHALPDLVRFLLLKKDYLLENTDKANLRSLFRYIAARPDTDLNAVFAPHGGRRPFFRSLRELLTALLG